MRCLKYFSVTPLCREYKQPYDRHKNHKSDYYVENDAILVFDLAENNGFHPGLCRQFDNFERPTKSSENPLIEEHLQMLCFYHHYMCLYVV